MPRWLWNSAMRNTLRTATRMVMVTVTWLVAIGVSSRAPLNNSRLKVSD